MDSEAAWARLFSKFTSGNAIAVSRVVLTREEWDAIKTGWLWQTRYAALRAEVARMFIRVNARVNDRISTQCDVCHTLYGWHRG